MFVPRSVSRKPQRRDPAKLPDPAKPQDPAKSQDPAKPQDPAKLHDPAKPHDPANLKLQDPASLQDPAILQDPTTVKDPAKHLETLGTKNSVEQNSSEAGLNEDKRPSADLGGSHSSEEEEDEPVISYSKQQRWPVAGEPVCVVCGRYGAYIVDDTDRDVCSLECKAKHLAMLGKSVCGGGGKKEGMREERICSQPEEGLWRYTEHPAIAGMSRAQVDILRNEVCMCLRA